MTGYPEDEEYDGGTSDGSFIRPKPRIVCWFSCARPGDGWTEGSLIFVVTK